MSKSYPIDALADLLGIMARLRDPQKGCPWDVEQDFSTIAPYTVEEAYEVADAIEHQNMDDLKEELGDLLFQVVFHARMAEEQKLFDFNDVVTALCAKMISRHPHVFGDQKAEKASDVNAIWELGKDREKKRRGADSILDDVPRALPALLRGQKLQNRAARVGFEWPDVTQVLDKMEEEIAEMRQALRAGKQDEIRDELGDLLFVLTNLGRMLGVDCETAMQQANNKFTRRFKGIEVALKAENISLQDATLEKMESLWQAEKRKEKKTG